MFGSPGTKHSLRKSLLSSSPAGCVTSVDHLDGGCRDNGGWLISGILYPVTVSRIHLFNQLVGKYFKCPAMLVSGIFMMLNLLSRVDPTGGR